MIVSPKLRIRTGATIIIVTYHLVGLYFSQLVECHETS